MRQLMVLNGIKETARVLIVEDEIISRELLFNILIQRGYEVVTAIDAEHALETLNHDRRGFETIVTDKMMPGMSGIQFFRQLKADARFKKIPVIMQTASSKNEEIIEGINAGLYYYLVKPYDVEMLASIVKAAVREFRQQKKAEALILKNRLALGNFNFGEFSFKTIEEASNISSFLASLYPNPESAHIGLYELMLNAIEHGNLGIKYDFKTKLIASNQWEEEINRRIKESGKEAKLYFEKNPSKITVIMTDQGEGFDWQPFMKIEPGRAVNNHGRGIAKANLLSFDEMRYEGQGNKVICMVNLNGPLHKMRAA